MITRTIVDLTFEIHSPSQYRLVHADPRFPDHDVWMLLVAVGLHRRESARSPLQQSRGDSPPADQSPDGDVMDCRDPDYWQYLRDLKTERDREWLAGEITDAIYTGRLLAYGYTPANARTELNLLKMSN